MEEESSFEIFSEDGPDKDDRARINARTDQIKALATEKINQSQLMFVVTRDSDGQGYSVFHGPGNVNSMSEFLLTVCDVWEAASKDFALNAIKMIAEGREE